MLQGVWRSVWKKIWHDPVGSKLISAGILGAIGIAVTSWFEWWPAIGNSLSAGWVFVVSDTATPNWVLGLLALLTLPLPLLLFAALWDKISKRAPEPTWRNYVTDFFFDLRWRWEYEGGYITRVYAFCPFCDYQVSHRSESSLRAPDGLGVAFRCDSCKRTVAHADDRYDVLVDKVERFIEQKIRNGAWRGVVEGMRRPTA